jgi:hypothetical protein
MSRPEDAGVLAVGEQLRLHPHRLVEAQLNRGIDRNAMLSIGRAGEAQVEPPEGGPLAEEAHLEVDQMVQAGQRVAACG